LLLLGVVVDSFLVLEGDEELTGDEEDGVLTLALIICSSELFKLRSSRLLTLVGDGFVEAMGGAEVEIVRPGDRDASLPPGPAERSLGRGGTYS